MKRYRIRKQCTEGYKYVLYFIRKGILPNGESTFQVEYTTNPNQAMLFNEKEAAILPASIGEKVLVK